ncbi:hypothetical protein GCM10009756_25130 [Pseudokineococcus marinus]
MLRPPIPAAAARAVDGVGVTVFSPRDERASLRALRAVLVLAAVVLGAYTALRPPPGWTLWAVVGVVVALLAGSAALAVAPHRAPRWVHGAVPLASVGLVTGLDLLTRDATTAGQVFFLLPVLVAATHLRAAGAWVVTAAAVVGEVVTTASLLPLEEALTDSAYVGAVAVALTGVLARAHHRTDALVEELRRQAAVDPLTGLVTRRVLDDAAACALTSAHADAGTALVLVDVDRFKAVNDTHGHPVGDALLVHLGRLVHEVVPASAVVSRLGGDELAVLLPGTSARDALRCAEEVAGRVREKPLTTALPTGAGVAATVSVGVAHAPEHARDLAGLYRAADAALYRAKAAGRDGVAAAGPPGAPAPPPAPRRPRDGAVVPVHRA